MWRTQDFFQGGCLNIASHDLPIPYCLYNFALCQLLLFLVDSQQHNSLCIK